MEVVAMLRFVAKTRQRQTKRRRQTSGEAGGETSKETRQPRQTKHRSQQTSGETRKKE